MPAKLTRAMFLLGAVGFSAGAVLSRWHLASLGNAGPFETSWGWTRTEPLLTPIGSGWEGSRIWEPSVLIDTPNNEYRMYYDGGDPPASANQAMGVATCSLDDDPTVPANWTKNAGNPIFGKGGSGYAGTVSGSNVYFDGASYYCTFYNGSATSDLMIAVSSDGLFWGPRQIAIAKDQVAWASGWANSFVWNDGSWEMLVDSSGGTGSIWKLAYAISSDGRNYTVQGTGPIADLAIGVGNVYGAPWLPRSGELVSGKLRLFYHAAPTADANFTNIYSAYSEDAGSSWTVETTPHLTFTGGTYSATQVADASVVEHAGTTYLFYSGVNQSTTSYINVAAFAGSLEELLNP